MGRNPLPSRRIQLEVAAVVMTTKMIKMFKDGRGASHWIFTRVECYEVDDCLVMYLLPGPKISRRHIRPTLFTNLLFKRVNIIICFVYWATDLGFVKVQIIMLLIKAVFLLELILLWFWLAIIFVICLLCSMCNSHWLAFVVQYAVFWAKEKSL